jgi:hypothetical protein
MANGEWHLVLQNQIQTKITENQEETKKASFFSKAEFMIKDSNGIIGFFRSQITVFAD